MTPADLVMARLAAALSDAVNAASEVDRALAERLRDLDGHAVRLEPDGGALPALNIRVEAGRVQVTAEPDPFSPSDVTVRGQPHAIAALWLGAATADVEIIGDEDTLADFRHCFRPAMPALELPDPSRLLASAPWLEQAVATFELGAAGVRSALEAVTSALAGGLPNAVDGAERYAETTELDAAAARLDRLAARSRALEETIRRLESRGEFP